LTFGVSGDINAPMLTSRSIHRRRRRTAAPARARWHDLGWYDLDCLAAAPPERGFSLLGLAFRAPPPWQTKHGSPNLQAPAGLA